MNKKAEKFNALVAKMPPDTFHVEELSDEFQTVVYRSRMEVNDQFLPMAVVLDNSLYSLVRVWAAANVVTDENRARLAEFMNEMNRHFKVFKYYMTEEGDVVIDCCLPSDEAHFDGEVVSMVVDVVLQHLQEKYGDLLAAIGANAAPAAK